MGLAISLGILTDDPDADPEEIEWRQKDLDQVNRVLAENGLPPYEEPKSVAKIRYRGHLLGFPYSWLHYLRRAVAFARQAPKEFCPVPEGRNPAHDDRIDHELSISMDSHLICHSDCEGFYVPIDFPEPLYDGLNGKLPGGILGSSQRALEETMLAAPLLSIPLKNGKLSDKEVKVIVKEEDESHPYWLERKVWLTIFETFRHSVEYKLAVAFG